MHAQSIVQITVLSIMQSICRPKIIQFEHLGVNLVVNLVVNLAVNLVVDLVVNLVAD